MRDPESWSPSKFVFRGGRLATSRDAREIGKGSRLTADLVAKHYGQHLPQHARGRLLDLGCGKVPLYDVYRDLVSEITCVDWNDSEHGSRHVDVACDLSEPLPFEDDAFDTILLSDVLEHLPEPEALWREMSRVLSPGGTLLMNVPFFYWLHEKPHDYYRYTEFALRRFVARAGLELVLLEAMGGAPEVVVDIGAKMLVQIPKLGGTAALALQGLASALLRTPPGRRLSRSSARDFPLAYILIASQPEAGSALERTSDVTPAD